MPLAPALGINRLPGIHSSVKVKPLFLELRAAPARMSCTAARACAACFGGTSNAGMCFGVVTLIWFAGLVSVLAASPERIAARAPVAALNIREGTAVKGYDVVAYFTEGKPVKGSPAHAFKWQGATWQFASAEHRAAFARHPAKYAPQYGGYCAFAVSQGNLVDIDPRQWKIVAGRLYLNANFLAQGLWVRDPAGHIKKGDANWQFIPRRPL